MIETATTSALHAATEEIATMLLADFDAGTYDEDFYVHTTLKGGQCYRANLALNHGFVTGAPVVKTATTYAGLADGDVLDASEYKFDTERGELNIISATNYFGYYVRVSYAAGFAVDETDDELYADVPEWLQLAATKMGSAILIELAPDLQGGGNGDQGRKPEEIRKAAARMLEKRTRTFPSPIRPM